MFIDRKLFSDRALRNVFGWAMKKKRITKKIVASIMTLYEEAMSIVRVVFVLSKILRSMLRCTKDLCCHLYSMQL